MKRSLKISGFKTPDKYFENFEEELSVRMNEEKLPQKAGFSIPDDYFGNLEDRVIATVINKKEQNKVILLFRKKYFGYAAAIAACLVIGTMIFNSTQNKSTLDTIQIGLIDKYIDDGNLNMDLYDLTSYLQFQDIPTTIDFENQHFSQPTLENYILETTEEDILMEDR